MIIRKKISNKYKKFSNSLMENFIPIPYLYTKYIPQSFCKYKDYTIVGCFDSRRRKKGLFSTWDRRNSLIHVINNEGKVINTLVIDGKYHLGGIDIDYNSGSLYVTASNGYVNRYLIRDIININNKYLYKKEIYMVDSDRKLISYVTKNSSIAFLNIYNGKLYLGNFNKNGNSNIKIYKLDKDGKIVLGSEKVIRNPYNYTQGMCIYRYKNTNYYIFSTSYGMFNNSILYISRLIDNEFVTVKRVSLPPMSEQVNNINNNIGILFESGSIRYFGCLYKIRHICEVDIKILLDK